MTTKCIDSEIGEYLKLGSVSSIIDVLETDDETSPPYYAFIACRSHKIKINRFLEIHATFIKRRYLNGKSIRIKFVVTLTSCACSKSIDIAFSLSFAACVQMSPAYFLVADKTTVFDFITPGIPYSISSLSLTLVKTAHLYCFTFFLTPQRFK